MKSNQEFKNAALAALKGNWAPALVATIILVAVIYVFMGPYLVVYNFAVAGKTVSSLMTTVSYALFAIGGIFLLSPMSVGYIYSSYQLLAESDAGITSNMIGKGFKPYFRNVWGMFLMGLFTNLWFLLLIIPGFIKMYSYSMTPYILVDHPELSANQAINLSIRMMKGHKFDLFFLHLSFIGWGILSVLTAGVGLLWLIPYMNTAQAAFYQVVRNEYNSIINN